MKISDYRSVVVNINHSELYTVVDSAMLMAKNVYNPTLFIIKNIFYLYSYNKESKNYVRNQEFKPNQKEIFEFFNSAIDNLNNVRLEKFHIKNENLKELKLLPLLTNEITSKDLRKVLLDKTLIEHVLKLKELKSPYKDYSNIYSSVSQYALQKTIEDCSNYFKATIAYWKIYQAGDKINLPQFPSYLGKNDRLTLDMFAHFSKKGTLFTVLDKHNLYSDFNNPINSKLSEEVIEQFNGFNLEDALYSQLNKRLKGKEFKLQTVRFVPQRTTNKGKNKNPVKIEAVIEVPIEIDDQSSLAKLIKYYEGNKEIYKKSTLSFQKLPEKIQNKVITAFIAKNKKTQFSLAGLDLGIKNIASVGFSHGENKIYSAEYINKYLTNLNTRIDSLKTSLFESNLSPALLKTIKYNQEITEQNKDKLPEEKEVKIKLSIANLKEIKEANRVVYTNISYNKLVVKIENFKKNTLHNLSEAIISSCVQHKVDFLVVGHNELWKQEIALGKAMNKIFMSLPHSQLIELLKYKATSRGIVLICTEESYTSKASFLHNDVMPVFNKKSKNKAVEIKEEFIQDLDIENNHSQGLNKKAVKFSGKRDKLNYTLNSKINNTRKIHADLNGAFNSIRKIFSDFKYTKDLKIGYNVYAVKRKNKKTINKDNRKAVFFSLLKKSNKHFSGFSKLESLSKIYDMDFVA